MLYIRCIEPPSPEVAIVCVVVILLLSYLLSSEPKMVNPRHDSVSSITPAKESWTIIARVVHLWFVSDFSKQKLPFSMEMVLQDDKVAWFISF